MMRSLLLCLYLVIVGASASASPLSCPYIEDSELGALCIADGFISCISPQQKALQKEIIWEYITARESYAPSSFAKQWNVIATHSSDALFEAFKQAFKPEEMKYIITVTPEQSNDAVMTSLPTKRCDRHIMQVEFTKNTSLKDGMTTQKKTVTIHYVFLQTADNVPYKDSNPTGFKVLAYRSDDDV